MARHQWTDDEINETIDIAETAENGWEELILAMMGRRGMTYSQVSQAVRAARNAIDGHPDVRPKASLRCQELVARRGY